MSDNKHILYTSCLCSKKMEQIIMQIDPQSIGLQVQKYHRLLAKGFVNNGMIVDTLSHHKAIEKQKHIESEETEGGIRYHYIGSNRKYIGLLKDSFAAARDYLKRNKDAVMVCDVLNLTVSLGAAIAARLCGRQAIGIITDFPEQMSGKQSTYSRLVWKLVGLCTGYIVLTEQMKEKLNPHKPAIVLEGHVDSDMKQADNTLEQKYAKKVCLYAGMLHRKYGIEKLVKAFCALERDDSELHIYGDGDYAQELKKNITRNIKYFGIVPNDVVVKEEIRASLLLNPRPTEEEYTKYSFPSKNMEYMASGTPLLTTDLPGMPKEYLDYVYIFREESIKGMTETLDKTLSESKEDLYEKGIAARTFVLREKSETAQAKKVIDFFMK